MEFKDDSWQIIILQTVLQVRGANRYDIAHFEAIIS